MRIWEDMKRWQQSLPSTGKELVVELAIFRPLRLLKWGSKSSVTWPTDWRFETEWMTAHAYNRLNNPKMVHVGPGDQGEPVITILLPDED